MSIGNAAASAGGVSLVTVTPDCADVAHFQFSLRRRRLRRWPGHDRGTEAAAELVEIGDPGDAQHHQRVGGVTPRSRIVALASRATGAGWP